jgi:hypothetical protein
MIVNLEWYEYDMAASVGLNRKVQSLLNGHRDLHNVKFTPITDVGWSVVSAVAEYAAAKALNKSWDGAVNTFSRPDLPNIEIKSQQHHTIDEYKKRNFLFLRKDCDDDLNHLLVLIHSHLRYELAGYITGAEAKQEKFYYGVKGRPSGYGVPIDDLHKDFESL